MMNQSAATSVETIRKSRLGGVSMTTTSRFPRSVSRERFQPQTLFASHLVGIERRFLAVCNCDLKLRFELERNGAQPPISWKKRQVALETLAEIELDIGGSSFFQIGIGKRELPLLHDALRAHAETLRGIALRIGVGEARGVAEVSKRSGDGNGGCRFAASALLIDERDDLGLRESHLRSYASIEADRAIRKIASPQRVPL